MAQIRLGDFGNRIAPAQRGARVSQAAFVTADTQQASAMQQTAQAMVSREQAEQEAEAKAAAAKEVREAEQRQKDLLRAKSVEAYAGFNADLDEFTDTLSSRLAAKEITRDALPAEFDKGLAELKKKRSADVDPDSLAMLSAHFVTAERGARNRLRKVVDVDVKNERIASINTTGEELQRLAVKDPAKAISQWNTIMDAEGPGVLGADKVAGQKQAFAERAWSTHFTERITAARNDGRALSQLEREIAGNEALDPDKRNILVGRVVGQREVLASRAERAERSRIATLERQVTSLNNITLQGYDVPAEQLMAVQQAAKGTPLEPQVRQMVAFSNESARFRALPPQGQEAYLNDLESKIRKQPTPETIQFLDKLRGIAKNQQELVRNDPISFAGQRGLAEVKPLDFSQPATLKDQLLTRLTVSEGLRKQYGAPLKLLTTEEAKSLSDFLRRGTADDKTQLLGALKSAIPSAGAYQATMQQIAPDSPVTAWAGALMNRRPYVQENLVRADVETAAAKTAQMILRGEALLNPPTADKKQDGRGKAMAMPKDKDLVADFESIMGDAYRGRADAHNIAMQSARAVYAAMSAEVGDYSGEYNSSRWRQAVELSTGGVADINGAKVVRPYGMREGEFKDAVFSEIGRLSAAGRVGLTKPMLSRLQLEGAGDAKYLLKSGTGYLLDKAGQPVMIDLSAKSVLPEGFKDNAGAPVSEQIPR